MRYVYSLLLLAFSCLTATLSYATPTPQEFTLVFCAPKGTSTEVITEMGIAKFAYKINPVEAAAIVQETVSDYPTLPKVVCTGEITKIMQIAKIGNHPTPTESDHEFSRKIADAVTKTHTSFDTFTRGDNQFFYRTIAMENAKEVFMESRNAQASEQKDAGLTNSGISDYMSKNTGMLLLLPPLAFGAAGASEYTIYYVVALALGISFHQTGIWNSLTILTLNTAGIIAQANLLYQQNKGAEFQDDWDTGGYALETVKEEYQKLHTEGTDYNTVATTSWAVLSQQVAVSAFTFSSIKMAAAKYLGMGARSALGVSFGQAAFNIIFESLTGSPLEDCIPIFKYNRKHSAISAKNWPYYGKKFVASNFFLIHWAAKQSGLIASRTAWLGKHLAKASSFLWRKNKQE